MTRERERERERALLGTTVHDEEVSADIADTVAPTADEDEDDDYQLSHKEVKKEESKDTKIIFPIHPRTRAHMEKFGLAERLDQAQNLIMTVWN